MTQDEMEQRLAALQDEVDGLYILLQHAQNLVDALERGLPLPTVAA